MKFNINYKQIFGIIILIVSILSIIFLRRNNIYGAPGYIAILIGLISLAIILYYDENIDYGGEDELENTG